MSTQYTSSDLPFFCWLKSHIKLNTYKPTKVYYKNNIVAVDDNAYQSTINNNTNEPTTLIGWVKIH